MNHDHDPVFDPTDRHADRPTWGQPPSRASISVCIATYRRPDRLGHLLDDLVRQSLLPLEVVVVDNDATGSAREVVAWRRARGCPFELVYGTQPEQNIALTRNRSVALAHGSWLAFIDDDERAAPHWLADLVEAACQHAAFGQDAADAVLGPVVPLLPETAPAWIRAGDFYRWPRSRTGAIVPLNRLRFGNVLVRGALLRDRESPFDPAYGLTGGEDGELLGRLVQQGARVIWCDEAVVTEPVEASRQNLRWLMLRGLRGGQDYARHRLSGRFGRLGLAGRAGLMVRSAAQCAVALVLVPLGALLGRHRAAQALILAAANAGKVSGCAGWHYREYATTAGAAS
ncbi:glycosyltransferase family 2 protein [Leptothrix discophora]|uniref:Glycosyltransferase family A protein n=1 Tax=Leptothrix discophora TaxID=89 RepID=A0ABT9G8K8_LEPDI|nr:glycosyltransferase family A protein [Leptothrix discophora]MDP4302818.1 glycosyltransferase family A protein [Leptothrix discophora]